MLNQYPDLHEEIDGGLAIREYKSMHADLNAFVKDNSRLTSSEKSKLKNMAQKLLEVDLLTDGDRNAIARGEEEKNTQATIYEEVGDNSADMARKIHARIASLQEGECLLFRGCAKGHSFLYEVRKEGDDYRFTIINTGRDEEGGMHRNRIDEAKPGRYTYAHKAYQCSLEALSEEFLQSLLPHEATNKVMPVLLQSIETQLKAKGARDALGRQHHPQERGNCVFKSVSSWLKGEMIHEFGEERGAAIYEEFKASRTKKMIKQLREMEKGMSKQEIAAFYNISVQSSSWQDDLADARSERDSTAQEVYKKRQAKTNPPPQRLGDSEYLFNLLKIE